MNKPIKTQPLIQHDWVDIKFNLRNTWNLIEAIWFLFFSYIYLFILTCVSQCLCGGQWAVVEVCSFLPQGGFWGLIWGQWQSDPLSHLLNPRSCDSYLPLSLFPPLDFCFQPPGWMGVNTKQITLGPRSSVRSWHALRKRKPERKSHHNSRPPHLL